MPQHPGLNVNSCHTLKEVILRYTCMVVSVLSQEVTFVIKSIDSSQSTYIETLYTLLRVV